MSNDVQIVVVKHTRPLHPEDAAHWGASCITVTGKIHKLAGNARPYFSVTADIRSDRGKEIAGGMLHAEVLRAFPELAPVAAVNLSDDDGVPIHSEANGWYWLAAALGGMGERYHGGNSDRQHWKVDPGSVREVFDGYRHSTPTECLQVFADHCRVSIAEARAIADEVKSAPVPRERWSQLCAAMGPRWAVEAAAAITAIKSIK